jgi:four helix bundle protein
MISVVVGKKMELSPSGASAFRNMAVWECAYNLCLDVCRVADGFEDQNNSLTQKLREVATSIPLDLSAGGSFRMGRNYITALKKSFVASKQLSTLVFLCHDLGYIPTEKFMDLNSKITIFSTKLFKYLRFCEKKLREKQKQQQNK